MSTLTKPSKNPTTNGHSSKPARGSGSKSAKQPDFKVKDLEQAELGRKEIRLAEHEMPGLMALRERY